MNVQEILPQADVARIAIDLGFEPDERDVLETAEHARSCHGNVCEGYNGDGRLYWHVDPYTRRVDATLLFTGHLQEEARVRGCETREAARFERDAYGYDD